MQAQSFPTVTDPKHLRHGDIFRAILTNSTGERKQMLFQMIFNPTRQDNLKQHRTSQYMIKLLMILDPKYPPAKSPSAYYEASGRVVQGIQYVKSDDWFVKRQCQLVTWDEQTLLDIKKTTP